MTTGNEALDVLRQACTMGRTDIVKHAINELTSLLKEKGMKNPDLDLRALISSSSPINESGTPLHSASSAGHKDVIRALLNAGAQADVTPVDGIFAGQMPYQVATDVSKEVFHVHLFEQIASGNLEGCIGLIDAGIPANLSSSTTNGDTALHWACNFGMYDIAAALLDAGALPNHINDKGQTPLHYACKNSSNTIVVLLLNNGADSTILDNENKLPLDLLDPNDNTIRILIEKNPGIVKALPPRARSSSRTKSYSNTAKNNDDDDDDDVTLLSYGVDDADEYEEAVDGLASSLSAGSFTAIESSPLLVVWPPLKMQTRIAGPPLRIYTNTPVYICIASVTIDIFPLLTWSGLVQVLDERFGVAVQVKRSGMNCHFHFRVNPQLCPGHHRYEIHISETGVSVIASDSTGLLYAAQTLTQIVSLHAELKEIDHQVSVVELPLLEIVDFPDVSDRGVMYSYNSDRRLSSSMMRSIVQLLSRVRANKLYLVLDDDSNSRSGTCTNTGDNNITSSSSASSSSTVDNLGGAKLCALDEACRRHSIDLVPTIHIRNDTARERSDSNSGSGSNGSSSSQDGSAFSIDIVQNVCSDVMCVILAMDERIVDVASSSSSSSTIFTQKGAGLLSKNDKAKILATKTLEFNLQNCLSSGIHACLFVCNAWCLVNVPVLKIARRHGIDAQVRPWKHFMAPSTMSRPLTCIQDLVVVMKMWCAGVSNRGQSLSVVPGMTDAYFASPQLINKYLIFLHAGFCWNQRGVAEMLGRRTDVGILKDCILLVLFDKIVGKMEKRKEAEKQDALTGSNNSGVGLGLYSSSISSGNSDTTMDLNGVLMELMTGPISAMDVSTAVAAAEDKDISSNSNSNSKNYNNGYGYFGYSSASTNVNTNSNSNHPQELHPPLHVASSEASLMALVCCGGRDIGHLYPPPKAALIVLLRHYRRVLAVTDWKTLRRDMKGTPSNSPIKGSSSNSNSWNSNNNNIDAKTAEAHQYVAFVSLLSVVCRALILGYNASLSSSTTSLVPKTLSTSNSNDNLLNYDNDSNNGSSGKGDTVTISALINSLQSGTKTDIANGLLESINAVVDSWNNIFDSHRISKDTSSLKVLIKSKAMLSSSSASIVDRSISKDPLVRSRAVHLHNEEAELPGLAFLRLIADALRDKETVETFVDKITH